MMNSLTLLARRFLTCALPVTLLAACGGFGGAIIGGTVSGLASGTSFVIQNNATESLTITANGTFAFVDGVDSGETYSVAVSSQPTGQTCTTANATGTVDSDSDDVTSVVITCATTASLGGTVTGLNSGTAVTLTNNGVQVTVGANGNFTFPGIITAGTPYNVTIVTQPAGLTCTVSNPTGNIVANVMSSVTVSCS